MQAKQVSNITKWVYDNFVNSEFDFIMGHSLGGIIALELVSKYNVKCQKVIFVDTNLKPACDFYKNLLLSKNIEIYKDRVFSMLKEEMKYYSKELINSVQDNFDFTDYVLNNNSKIYGIYGDRGVKDYINRINDLNLSKEVQDIIEFCFIKNSCHMPMLENKLHFKKMLNDIINLNKLSV